MKLLLLLLTIALGLCTIVKGLQVSLTPDAWTLIARTGERLIASSGFGFLVAMTAIVALLTACVAAWQRSEQAYREQCEARRRAIEALNKAARDQRGA